MSHNPAARPERHVDDTATQAPSQSMQRAAVEGHGNSPAAWALVIISLLGLTIAAVAVVLSLTSLFYAGVGVTAGGFLVGLLMQVAGFGVAGSRLKSRDH